MLEMRGGEISTFDSFINAVTEIFEIFQDPFLKFSLKLCILIIVHRKLEKSVSQD